MKIVLYLLALWILASLLVLFIGYLISRKKDAQETNEYYVEFTKNGRTLCQFGVIASSPREAAEIVEKDTGGAITQVAIREPEDRDGTPVYNIVSYRDKKRST